MPDALARVNALAGLTEREKLTLNHIRGATYLHLFGLVEEFILPFAVERARDGIHASKDRVRALLTFAEEEAKHQQLFQRFAAEFRSGFKTPIELIGPATAIAETVLEHSPLSIAILILHLEWTTQRHYLESVKTDQQLDPQFVSLLKHHWQEEAQHERCDTLVLQELADRASPEQIEKAIDDFLAIGGILEGGLQQQVKYDLGAFQLATGRKLSADEAARISAAQLGSYRWTFLVSGLEQHALSAGAAWVATRYADVPGVGRNIGQADTGWGGYLTGSAVQNTNTERAAKIGRWWVQRQHRLPANGRAICGRSGGMPDYSAAAVDVGPVDLHEDLRPRERAEAGLGVQAVGVARGEHPAPQALQLWVSNDDVHQPDAQATPARRRVDEHVGHVGEGGAVAHDARESDLALLLEDPERDRVADGAGDRLARNAGRPVGLAQPAPDGVEVEARRIRRDGMRRPFGGVGGFSHGVYAIVSRDVAGSGW